MSASFLLEIGMEECPARFIDRALNELKAALQESFAKQRLKHGDIETFGTPRRLALMVHDVAERQVDLEAEIKGPPARIAFDDAGNPTKAALGFAKSQDVPVEQLTVKESEAGQYVVALKREAGKAAEEVLPQVISDTLSSLRFPKSMRWDESGFRFARPIRWIVALLSDRVIEVEVAGVRAGRTTYGHRFLAPDPLELRNADEYVEVLLNQGQVVVEVGTRRSMIQEQLNKLAIDVSGTVEPDEALLSEVTHLVELPTALLGSFDSGYLEVPQEILVTSMKEHQRYFPVQNANGELLPYFIAVRNGNSDHLDIVRKGNERVLAARLSDARFFYDEDRKKPLSDYVKQLSAVLFQEQLGSVWDKVQRVRACIQSVVRTAGIEESIRNQADQAAVLAKADLVTQVVFEFPELQGTMGRQYALLSGEDPVVAEAIFEHYLPRFSQDDLPKTMPGTLVALADKMDTIVGCFSIGLIPTGSADPYALRRQALGIIRILLREDVDVALGSLVDAALDAYTDGAFDRADVRSKVLDFFSGRLSNLLAERGFRYDLIAASLDMGIEDLKACEARVFALAAMQGAQAFQEALATYHRAANIARNVENIEVNPSYFEDEKEKILFQSVVDLEQEVEQFVKLEQYQEAIQALARLKSPLDQFFDSVRVMAEDPKVKDNRLGLLGRVVALFNTVASWKHIAEE